jgi:hypothetical protein
MLQINAYLRSPACDFDQKPEIESTLKNQEERLVCRGAELQMPSITNTYTKVMFWPSSAIS